MCVRVAQRAPHNAAPNLLCCVCLHLLTLFLTCHVTQELAQESQEMISRQTAKLLDDRCVCVLIDYKELQHRSV